MLTIGTFDCRAMKFLTELFKVNLFNLEILLTIGINLGKVNSV